MVGEDRRCTRVFIWGSCVSRDTFGFLPPDEYSLTHYLARQSAISAASPPVTLIPPPALESPFQQRMIEGDFQSNLLDAMRASGENTDLLLIDLTDERLGVYELPDGTVLTRSYELLKVKGHETLPPGAKHLEFGTPRHRVRWSAAIEALAPEIRAAVRNARIVLLDIAWATRMDSGQPTRPSFGVTARRANRLFPLYVRTAVDALQADVLTVLPAESFGSTRHRWGDAPFHYTDSTYMRVVEALSR